MASEERSKDIGALWKKQSRGGANFMTGRITCPSCSTEHKVVVFKNDRKTEDKHPDARIYPERPREGGDR